MYNKYKWEEWAKEGFVVPMPEIAHKSDPMNCLKTLVKLFADGQQLVPIQEGESQVIIGDKTAISERILLGEDDDAQESEGDTQ